MQSQEEEDFLKQDAEEIMRGKPYHWRDWSIVLDEDCLYLWSDAAVLELRKDSNGWFRFVLDENLTTMYFGGTYGNSPDESRREFLEKLLAVQSQMQTGFPSQPILSAPDATRLVVGNWSLSCIKVGKISVQNCGKLKETITLYENCPGFKFQSNITLGKIPFIAEVSLGPEFPAGWAKRKEKRFNAKSKLEDSKQKEENFLKQDAEEIMRGKPYHWRDWSIVLDEDLYLWSDAAVIELRKDSNGWFRFVIDRNLTTMYFGGTYGVLPDESRREFLEKLLAVQSQMETGLPIQPILSAPDATRLVVGNWSLSCICVGKISLQNSGKLKETITLYENCPGFKFQSNVTLGKIPFIAEVSLGPEFPAGWAKRKEKRFNAKSKLEDLKQKCAFRNAITRK